MVLKYFGKQSTQLIGDSKNSFHRHCLESMAQSTLLFFHQRVAQTWLDHPRNRIVANQTGCASDMECGNRNRRAEHVHLIHHALFVTCKAVRALAILDMAVHAVIVRGAAPTPTVTTRLNFTVTALAEVFFVTRGATFTSPIGFETVGLETEQRGVTLRLCHFVAGGAGIFAVAAATCLRAFEIGHGSVLSGPVAKRMTLGRRIRAEFRVADRTERLLTPARCKECKGLIHRGQEYFSDFLVFNLGMTDQTLFFVIDVRRMVETHVGEGVWNGALEIGHEAMLYSGGLFRESVVQFVALGADLSYGVVGSELMAPRANLRRGIPHLPFIGRFVAHRALEPCRSVRGVRKRRLLRKLVSITRREQADQDGGREDEPLSYYPPCHIRIEPQNWCRDDRISRLPHHYLQSQTLSRVLHSEERATSVRRNTSVHPAAL